MKTESTRTETAIAVNRDPRALTLRERILDWADAHRVFTMRQVRAEMAYRKAEIWNVRRVMKALVEAGDVVVIDVVKRAWVMKFVPVAEREAA